MTGRDITICLTNAASHITIASQTRANARAWDESLLSAQAASGTLGDVKARATATCEQSGSLGAHLITAHMLRERIETNDGKPERTPAAHQHAIDRGV